MNNDEISLLPYIIYYVDKKSYAAYIPYKITDENMIEYVSLIDNITNYLDLPNDRSLYSPSYTYNYNDEIHEIGILGKKLDKMIEAIKNIQSKLIEKKCIVDTNLIHINIENQ